jgi:thiol-disulfide isomerase/thioredoxin
MFEGRGPIAILLLVFLGGLALNLTPCVLPMIPINLAIIGAGTQSGIGHAPASRSRGFLLGATYGGAMALVYGILGVVVVLTAGTFGSINSTAWFNAGIAILFVVLALAMFDVIVIDFSRFSSGMFRGRQSGHRSSWRSGWAPVAALLRRRLRRAGRDSRSCSSRAICTRRVQRVRSRCRSCLGVGHGAARGRLPAPASPKLPKPGHVDGPREAGLRRFILADGRVLRLRRRIRSCRTGGSTPSAVTSSVEEQLKTGWHANLGEGLDLARREQKPVLIDMWATWCKNCSTMDKTTLKNEDVKAALDKYVRSSSRPRIRISRPPNPSCSASTPSAARLRHPQAEDVRSAKAGPHLLSRRFCRDREHEHGRRPRILIDPERRRRSGRDRDELTAADLIVTMPPPIGPPVLKRYASFPLAASSTRKSPVSSPVITTPPADVVAAATIGRGERYFHFTSPVEASIAVNHPWLVRSFWYEPPR